MSRFFTITAILKILTISLYTYAQTWNLKFEHLTTKDGLSQSSITCIIQDRKGFIWFGTQDGLNEYDGYNFTIYRHDPLDTSTISGNSVTAILEDRNGNLWIGSEGGLDLFKISENIFIHYKHEESDNNSLSNNNVISIIEDYDGNLWIGTNGGGLNHFEKNTESFTHYKHDEGNLKSISSNDVYTVFEDSKKNLWVGSWHGDLDLYDREQQTFRHYFYRNKKLSNNIIRDILEDRDGKLWICTHGDGLYKMVYSGNDKYEFDHYCHDVKDINSLSGDAVYTILEDSQGRLWIGTENEGLNIFNKEDNRFIHYRSDVLNENSLSHNSIWSFLEDKTGNVWIGTFAGGINMVPRYGGYFSHYKNNPGVNNSLSNNAVTSFCEDSRHNFWIGTDGGGLNLFNREKGTFICYDSRNSNLSSNSVLSVFEDSEGKLWVGTWGGGLNLFAPRTSSFTHYTKENTNLSSDNIFTIFEDKRGVLWFGAFWGGISCFDRSRNTFINYTPDNSDLSDNRIRVIAGDSYGMLWVGGDLGLNMFNPETGKFIIYKHEENDVYSLCEGWVLSILEANDSTLWIGTSGGLNKFNRGKQNFMHYQVKDGLPNNTIKGIREDEKGNLWLSTNKGLSKFNPETGRFKNYDVSDGLQDNEFYQCSHYKSRQGEIFFGGVNGFNSFNPIDIIDNPYIPPVIITDFLIFNKPVSVGKDSPLQTLISEAQSIKMSYRHSVFSFEFAALNYISSRKNQYAYKLDGFDQDWNYIDTKHTANYTNIDPGEYTFRVKGSNNDGIWNEEGTSIQIIITPPFWGTWWFKSGIIIFAVFLISLIFYVKVSQIRRRNLTLERLVKERTKEIDEKNKILIQQAEDLNKSNKILEERRQLIEEQADELKAQRDLLSEVNSVKDKLFSIIAHDLKNPFNTLKGFVDLIQTRYDDYTEQERKNMISIIDKSTDLVYNLLNNLLNWSRSQRGVIHFVPEIVNIVDLVNENIELFEKQAENKNIKIESRISAKDISLMIDKEMIHIVIRNILANAIKYTRVNGKIELNCTRENNNVIILVKDNGIGISMENKEKLFRNDIHFSTGGTNNETGTGIGLILCKELIEKHQGKIWIESELDQGTTIFVCLPVKGIGTDLEV
jgi:signal transduction histidine kinase/ligand-binding sensor domain-containing protein